MRAQANVERQADAGQTAHMGMPLGARGGFASRLVQRLWRSLDVWSAGVFLVACALLIPLSLSVVGQVHITGDEPWYLLQANNLLRFHTLDIAPSLNDSRIYGQFLGVQPDDHSMAIPGTDGRTLVNLPGYAFFLAPLYALGGRSLIVAAQALLAAMTATLLFREARRLFGSRVVALFATLAYLSCLPAWVYAGQLFPSTLAAFAAFCSFALVTRGLPPARGWRLVGVAFAVALLAALLAWLHSKYILVGLIALGLASWQLLRRLRGPSGVLNGVHGLADVSNVSDARAVRLALGALLTVTLVSFGLMAVYSHHYFGTWYPLYHKPPVDASDRVYAGPDPLYLLGLYRDMFLDAQAGLLPWAPLFALAPLGLALLAQRAARQAGSLALWLAGLLGAFVSALVAPQVFQGYAPPARFTVESLPFLALCVAGAFAPGWAWARAVVSAWRGGDGAARALTLRASLALAACAVCALLLGADVWFSLVAQPHIQLLYPGARWDPLVTAQPQALPGWWFHLFPWRPQQ